MPHIAPDMDDLFRKAAENYSLKRSANRWEEIASKLDDQHQPVKQGRKPNHKKYLVVLLFLFAFLVLVDIIPYNNGNEDPVHQISKSERSTELKSVISNANNNQLRQKPATFRFDINNKVNLISRSLQIDNEQGPVVNNTKTEDKYWNARIVNEKAALTDKQLQSGEIDIDIKNRREIELQPLNTDSKQRNKNPRHSFYYGLMAGAGFTNIKSQQVTRAGFEYGIVGGYRFGEKISVETGVLLSKKYYQTSGEYFSMKTISSSMPTDMKIMDVKSSTDFLQIPIHVRYDLINRNDHRFFASAGFSSYILFKESNSYHTMHNGNEAMMYSTYRNRGSYFAGSFDISIGYEKDIGNTATLRIEPYLQLPLKGVGVGELQLKTAGARLVLTRSSK